MDRPPADYSNAEALTSFSDVEADRLRRYVQLAEELRGSRFFAQERQSFEINVTPDSMSYDLPHGEDEELVTVMVTRLRKLHAQGRAEAASFPRIVRLLRAHADPKGNSHSQWFLEVLDSHEANVYRISNSSLIGLVAERVDREGNVISTEQVSPKDTFYDWLYGVYLHDDEEKLARVEHWKPLPVHRFNFLSMATDLARAYYGFSGIVREVLAEPTVMPAPSGG